MKRAFSKTYSIDDYHWRITGYPVRRALRSQVSHECISYVWNQLRQLILREVRRVRRHIRNKTQAHVRQEERLRLIRRLLAEELPGGNDY